MPALPGLPASTTASTPAQEPTLPAALPAGQVALYEVAKDDFPIKIVERFTGKQTQKGLSELAAANPTIGKRITDGKIYAKRDVFILPPT